jgi:hypothetical protein
MYRSQLVLAFSASEAADVSSLEAFCRRVSCPLAISYLLLETLRIN